MMPEMWEDREQMRTIRERYFLETERRPEGYLRHLRRCRFYERHNDELAFFCSCGLLHDLSELSSTLRDMLWPEFARESYCQDRGKVLIEGDFPSPEIKKEWGESELILVEVFGAPKYTDEEIVERHLEEKKLIQEVFGEEFLKSLKTDKVLTEALETQHKWSSLALLVEAKKAGKVDPSSNGGPTASHP